MSRPIYKPISWEEAAVILGNKATHDILLIEQENYTLGNPFAAQIPLELLSIQKWYLRCEQEEYIYIARKPPVRPEVRM